MPSGPVIGLLCLSLLLPATLFLGLLNNIMPFSVGPVSPGRWLTVACLPLLIAAYGLRKGSLVLSGAIAGVVIAQVIILANYGFLAQLLIFFLTGSRITKFRQHIKKNIEEDFKEGGGRDWLQVVCTAGPGAALSALYLLECGSGERWMDARLHYHSTLLTAAVLGSFSCANGDTFSSEVGTVVGFGDPWLITTLKRVPRGTNGGVSILGTLASVVGGALIGASQYVALYLSLDAPPPSLATPPQHCLLWLGALGGLLGSLIDSILGAILQYSGVAPSGVVVSRPGRGVRHISGRPVMSNHAVNLVTGAITAVILPVIIMMLY